MIEHEINKLDNFICGWYLNDDVICDKLIEYHENSSPCMGRVSGGIIEHVKKSFDCVLDNEDLLKWYSVELQHCVDEYIKKYEQCNRCSPWTIIQYPSIQKYEPNGAFYAWHTERGNGEYPCSTRHLVFMTYLNDVYDAGETEFYHQKIKVKPKKGLTLIWPADWTFTHRGVPSPTQEKYIITGWFNFINNAAFV